MGFPLSLLCFLSWCSVHIHYQKRWVLLFQHFGVGREVPLAGFLRECICSLRAVGCAWLEMTITAKRTAPKCFQFDGLLLHQIQQLFHNIGIFCSAVLCQLSLLSLRRACTGELIHQPSDWSCVQISSFPRLQSVVQT